MVDASPAATLRTENATLQENHREKVHEQIDKDIIPAAGLAHHQTRHHQLNTTATTSAQETTTQELQEQPSANQVMAIRKRIEQEDTRHSHNINDLEKQLTTEHARHSTRAKGFRSRLIDLSTAHRENLRTSPKKLQQQQQNDASGNEVLAIGTTAGKQGYIAKWLEGLKSMSSFSGLRESSDGMSSVEVVAAKDAKGRGKGIRIVSDGVEEGAERRKNWIKFLREDAAQETALGSIAVEKHSGVERSRRIR
ncbi:hypothetical protein KCU95_g9937, partial [Aureobasidium melanogenum]